MNRENKKKHIQKAIIRTIPAQKPLCAVTAAEPSPPRGQGVTIEIIAPTA